MMVSLSTERLIVSWQLNTMSPKVGKEKKQKNMLFKDIFLIVQKDKI